MNTVKEYTLPVKGMNCASCAITIKNTLKKVDGVINCEVNYGNEKIKLEIDNNKTSISELSKKIEPFGYSINDIDSNTHVMSDGTVMSNHDMHKGMDHSEHLGLNQTKEDKLKELDRQRRKINIVMPITLITFFLMMWEILSLTFTSIPKFPLDMQIYQSIALIVSTYVLFSIGGEFLKEVITFIKYRVANMYTLVGIGTLTSYIYSAIIVLFPSIKESLGFPDTVYFDVTIIVIGFIYLGKFLETRSKLKTSEAIEKLVNLQSKKALIERDGVEIELDINDVKVSDIVIVKPGNRIALDGIIIEGNSTVDESMITGESIPVDKSINDLVIGGTINKQGSFKFKVTKLQSETLLSQIIKLVDEAQGSKAPIQALADRISEIFVPLVLIISVISLLIWIFIGSMFMPFEQALSLGILCFTGVLVIACPCALGLATPTAIIVGTGKAASHGILIKNAESLEKLYKVNTIVTDKTGTITKGELEVNDIYSLNNDYSDKDIIQLLASLENKSEHPIALSILNKSKELNLELLNTTNFKILEGKGLRANIDDIEYYAGNIKLVNDLKLKTDSLNKRVDINELTNTGKTLVYLFTKKEIIGLVTVSDTLKDNALETVSKLHKLGIKVIMLTGDNLNTAKYIAKLANIDEVIADVLPKDKALIIKELQSKGNIVAMVGDGVNDAIALAQADVGIAMSNGSDIAIESASITLLKGDFSKVLNAIRLSKFTIRAIKQNLFWAFLYNIIGIPIAAGLLYPFGILLNPIFAGLAMALSSVSVVSNSLRLKFAKLN